jgi:hypothetical protein
MSAARSSSLSPQPRSSSQSSALGPQDYFILRGDAHTADDNPVAPDQILGKVVALKRNKAIRLRITVGKFVRVTGLYPLYLKGRLQLHYWT